ncbi:MAG: nucleotide sugar dehydrogenase, partial [Syntrophothermus sp.]
MDLMQKIENKTAVVGVIGLGYVGLPLALEFAEKDFQVYGFELDAEKVSALKQKRSYIKHISTEKISSAIESGRLMPTIDFSCLSAADAIIICVPTPLNEHREPDLGYVTGAARTVAAYLRRGQIVILESTTYPGTTEEILLPLFLDAMKERGELMAVAGNNGFGSAYEPAEVNQAPAVGKDFYLAFSPEREDPNNPHFQTSNIPKVIGGVTKECGLVAKKLYDSIIERTVPVSSARVAEAAKLLENIYRSVNIALVNELKIVLDKMDIDIWEVIEAASTKPFGFHPFYPGP